MNPFGPSRMAMPSSTSRTRQFLTGFASAAFASSGAGLGADFSAAAGLCAAAAAGLVGAVEGGADLIHLDGQIGHAAIGAARVLRRPEFARNAGGLGRCALGCAGRFVAVAVDAPGLGGGLQP